MKILLIRLRLIGDVVFTTPIPRALKREFPGCRIEYLVEDAAAPVLTGNSSIDELIVIPRARGMRRVLDDLALARRLRRKRFDLVIDLHGGPRSSWLAFATRAPRRIGYAIKGRSWMYTTAVPRPRTLRARHSVVNQWDLLQAIDGWTGGAADAARDAVEMPIDPPADARIGARLSRLGVTADHQLILAHVSAGNPFRRWPEPAFVRTLTELAAADDRRRIIVSSGPSDREAADRIAGAARAALGDRGSRLLEFGEFDLAELRALISRCRLFIGGDTGPLHIAATTSTPVVGLYGPTPSERSAPWRPRSARTVSLEVEGLPCRPCEQRVCEPGDFRCLTQLTAERVIAAAESVLR